MDCNGHIKVCVLYKYTFAAVRKKVLWRNWFISAPLGVCSARVTPVWFFQDDVLQCGMPAED